MTGLHDDKCEKHRDSSGNAGYELKTCGHPREHFPWINSLLRLCCHCPCFAGGKTEHRAVEGSPTATHPQEAGPGVRLRPSEHGAGTWYVFDMR